MARDVKIRDSYQEDAARLTRLSRAVELDDKKSVAWRKGIVTKINQLVVAFLEDTQTRLKIKKGKKQ